MNVTYNKEFDGTLGLNTYDHGARQHDAAIGRFTTVDPMAEKYYNISPYAYCGNNPVNRIDPDGRDYELSIDSLNNVITITATYYASSNSYESAVQAAKIINDQSKVYSYEVDGVSYVVNFNLNVVDTGMEVAELNLAKSMDDSGYANSY